MSADYIVQVGPAGGAAAQAAKREVRIEPVSPGASGSDGGFRITIDGRETRVSARRIESTSWSLLTEDGTQLVVDVDGTLPELRVTVAGGEPLRLQLQDARALALEAGASGAAGGQGAGELRASMPGKVVKVLCKAGDTIKPGQGLLVIEAMKMENELRAPGAGKITEVLVREGQTVEGGQLLVSLAPA
jgi:biotin carboxyl carrier protein